MRPSRGMGDIMPNKMPKGKTKKRRDDTDFTQYKEGGKVESKNRDIPGIHPILGVRGKKGGPVGLYANMNDRKKKGISRFKSKSTVTPEVYANMKKGFLK